MADGACASLLVYRCPPRHFQRYPQSTPLTVRTPTLADLRAIGPVDVAALAARQLIYALAVVRAGHNPVSRIVTCLFRFTFPALKDSRFVPTASSIRRNTRRSDRLQKGSRA